MIRRLSAYAAFFALLCSIGRADASIFGSRHRPSLVAAAIFGFGKPDEDKNENDPQQQRQLQQNSGSLTTTQQYAVSSLPPPPPPGPHQHIRMESAQRNRPPPPPKADDAMPRGDEQTGKDSQSPPPPPEGMAWQPDQAFTNGSPWPHNPTGMNFDPNVEAERLYMMQQDLEASMHREFDLSNRLANATTILAGMEQREELHVRQLDVLTERVMDVEAQAAQEHNQLLEYQANCSAMGLEMARLQGEVDQWKERCAKSDHRNKKQRADYHKLLKKLERAREEAESLATRVEKLRLEDLRSTYQERKKQSGHSRGGFLGWIFGSSRHDRDEEELAELQDMAKVTLLNALQTERKNVEELEFIASTLERNNTVIALQVQSRDEIIHELKERVHAFEDNKVVLKAALKQLQKEMGEEGPRTQKLIDDLKATNAEVERLEYELDSLAEQQEQKVASLEALIDEKDENIRQTKANVTMIGEYVNKLEERLADFALARRDIGKREQKCLELEKNAKAREEECSILREQINRNEKEHDELKSLMQEMVADRGGLQQKLAQLKADKQQAKKEVELLRDALETVERENTVLKQQPPPPPPPPPGGPNRNLHAQIQEYQSQVDNLITENAVLQEHSSKAKQVIADLREKLDQTISAQQELESELEQAVSTKANLEERMKNALKLQQMAEERLQEEEKLIEQRLADVENTAQVQLKEERKQLETRLIREKEKFQVQFSSELEDARRKLLEEKERSARLLKEEQDKMALTIAQELSKASKQAPPEKTPIADSSSTDVNQRGVVHDQSSKEASSKMATSKPDTAHLEISDKDASSKVATSKPDTAGTSAIKQSAHNSMIPRVNANATRPVNRTFAQIPKRPGLRPKQKTAGRSFRKLFAQATGLHGFFSKKYQRPPSQNRPPPRLINSAAARNSSQQQLPPPAALNNATARQHPAQQQQQQQRKSIGPEKRGNDPPGRHQIATPPVKQRQGPSFQQKAGTPPFVPPSSARSQKPGQK